MTIMDIRVLRNAKLKETDWTQLQDAPISEEKKQEYADYRQALRDFPSNADLNNPQWPVKPE